MFNCIIAAAATTLSSQQLRSAEGEEVEKGFVLFQRTRFHSAGKLHNILFRCLTNYFTRGVVYL